MSETSPKHSPSQSSNKSSIMSSQAKAVDDDGFSWPSLGAKSRKLQTDSEREERLGRAANAVSTLLLEIGEGIQHYNFRSNS